MPILLLAAIGWRLGVAFFGWPAPLRAVRLPLAIGTFFAVLFEYRTLNGIAAGSALLVVMIALKVLDRPMDRYIEHALKLTVDGLAPLLADASYRYAIPMPGSNASREY